MTILVGFIQLLPSSNLDSCWGNSLWARPGENGEVVVSGDSGVTKTLLATLIYN